MSLLLSKLRRLSRSHTEVSGRERDSKDGSKAHKEEKDKAVNPLDLQQSSQQAQHTTSKDEQFKFPEPKPVSIFWV